MGQSSSVIIVDFLKNVGPLNSMKITNVEFNVVLFYLLLNLHKKQGQDC